jgi:phosphoglycerol transferase MdoB-like AlkP superfamily enzyme
MKSNLPARVLQAYRPVYILIIASLITSMLTRIFLLSISLSSGLSAKDLLLVFLIGIIYDLVIAGFIALPMLLYLAFLNESMYRRKQLKWFIPIAVLLTAVLLFSPLVPADFNKDLYRAFRAYIALRWGIYLLLLLAGPLFRQRWRQGVVSLLFIMSIFLLLFNAVSEVFFWLEFSSRYNFIAVDYLVYTTEVLGNIRESYPLGLISFSIFVISVISWWLLRRRLVPSSPGQVKFIHGLTTALATILILLFSAKIIPSQWQYFSDNNYANELAGNGVYDFVQAFQKNELDYYQYYKTLPEQEAFAIVRKELNIESPTNNEDQTDILRYINPHGSRKQMNVVLISIESFSAGFMGSFGNTNHLTPQLDSIAKQGLLFTNFFAAGTRTVRGLEAISLAIPPLPGQSLVKRPDNDNLFSIGSVFRSNGYNTQYIYGGYSYFDNMKDFFQGNGYNVIDRNAIPVKEVHYANIWGVADEDLFSLALRQMNENYTAGRLFFSHVMTVSNHRPYTYPDGRIDISPESHSREGAVKYTDYCIGRFMKAASLEPWFNNTLFVIVADHCASSAGKTSLPVTGYHIPMIMFAPGKIAPGVNSRLMSQVDLAPSILGWLQWDYNSRFFGRDIFHDTSAPRAFISTYQGLGLLSGDTLIVQQPKKDIKAYRVDFGSGEAVKIKLDSVAARNAIAFYQVAASLIRRKKYTPERELARRQ